MVLYQRWQRRSWGTSTTRIVKRGRIWMWRWHKTATAAFMIQHWNANEALSCMRHISHISSFQLGSQLSLPFISSILKPNLHLCLGKAQWRSQTSSFRWTQVPIMISWNSCLGILSIRFVKVENLTFSNRKSIPIGKLVHVRKLFASFSFVSFASTHLDWAIHYLMVVLGCLDHHLL